MSSSNLNRSFSESDLYRSIQFGTPTRTTSYSTVSSTPQIIIRRSIVVEEIVSASSEIDLSKLKTNYRPTVIDKHIERDLFTQKLSLPSTTKKLELPITPIDQNIAKPQIASSSCFNSNSKENLMVHTPMEIDVDAYDNDQLPGSAKNLVIRRKPVPTSDFNTKVAKNGQAAPSKNGKNTKKIRRNIWKYLLLILVSYLVYCIYYENIYIYVNSDLQNEQIQKDLSETVYEQVGVVNTVVMSLSHRSYWRNKTKILGFIGPSGVGKTLIANVLKRNFVRELVHEIYGSHLNNIEDRNAVLQRIRSCCLNLIIIDDLKKPDIEKLLNFTYSLPKDTFILVVAIFNIGKHEAEYRSTFSFNDIVKVKKQLDDAPIYHDLVVFKPFNNIQVRYWIKKQLDFLNVDEQHHNRIIDKTLDGYYIESDGLKGLEKRLKLEIQKVS